jgi:geranylgeranyl diphosphate synthase type II
MPPKKGKQVVEELKKESEKGLALAEQIMLAEKMDPLKLRKALEHYLEHWNDFTHVGLFVRACESVGGKPDENTLAQAAIALMAAAFDLHDDILDRSKAKNKVPTVYGKFGVEISLLLGNAFLIEGLKTFSNALEIFPPEKREKILEDTKKLLFEVGNAHVLEICLKQRKRVNPNDYLEITELKAASIEADLMLGALFGGGSVEEIANLAKVGRILGVLATLRDDLVDVFDIEELRQRIAVQDLPLPLLLALQDKKTRLSTSTILSKPKITQNDVADLVDLTLQTKSIIKMKGRMQLLVEEGLSLLSKLPKQKLHNKLQVVVSFMLEDL